MANEVGAMLDCVVEGPGVAPPFPRLAWPCEVALVWLLPRRVLPGWCGYATTPIRELNGMQVAHQVQGVQGVSSRNEPLKQDDSSKKGGNCCYSSPDSNYIVSS